MATTAPLTNYGLENLSLGYISGGDLAMWGSQALIISQYAKYNNSLQSGCNWAYGLALGQLSTRYNIGLELEKVAFTNAQATATIATGSVTGLNILSGGTTYATPPLIVFGGPGTGASATAVLTNGVVTGITGLMGGTGYLTPPTVTFTGGNGAETRALLLVQIISLLALRIILGSVASLSADLIANFKMADTMMLQIRDGQLSLPLQLPPTQGTCTWPPTPGQVENIYSGVELVRSAFRTIG